MYYVGSKIADGPGALLFMEIGVELRRDAAPFERILLLRILVSPWWTAFEDSIYTGPDRKLEAIVF